MSPVAAARSTRATEVRRASTGASTVRPASTTKLVGRLWIAAIASPIEVASSGAIARALDLGAVDELVDDGAGAVDRRLAGEGRHREGQTRAHAGAQRAQRDEVGGLFGLGTLAAGNPDDPVPAVAHR